MVTLSPTISRSTQDLMASTPRNSRRASLTKASAAKVATMASASKAFTAARCSAMTLSSCFSAMMLLASSSTTVADMSTLDAPATGESRGTFVLTLPYQEGGEWFRDRASDHWRVLSDHAPEREDATPLPPGGTTGTLRC